MTREEEIKEQAEKKALEPSRLMHPYAKQYKVMSAYEIGFIEGAVWADSHPHWTSVEDELPPRRSEYDDLSNNVLATDGKKIYKSVYDYGFEEWFTRDVWPLYNITHWMPMPQAPKGERI